MKRTLGSRTGRESRRSHCSARERSLLCATTWQERRCSRHTLAFGTARPLLEFEQMISMLQSPTALLGDWVVRRESGILPPWGFSKRIREGGRGVTAFAGVPLFPFRVLARDENAAALDYFILPIRDELRREGPAWIGVGLCCGLRFCRFRLERP